MNELLVKLLKKAGMTTSELAERSGVDRKTAERWVTLGPFPHPRHRTAAAAVLGADPEEIWPDRRRDVRWLRPWREVEANATALRSFQPLVVPGLLQTEAYTRATLTRAAKVTREQIEKTVTTRRERQRILSRTDPPHLTAVIDEGALRRSVGDARVMREQLEHLVQATDAPHVRVHVVPTSAGHYAGMDGSFVLAQVSDVRLVGYVEHQVSGQLIESDRDVATLTAAWESCRGEALPHTQSVDLIKELAETWT